MFRLPLLFTLIASLFFSGLALAPDAHAGESLGMTHIGDHIAEHGMEHFAEDSEEGEGHGPDHPPAHHHNCSVDVPRAAKNNAAGHTFDASLFTPFKDSLLLSGALEVLIEPPIA